LARLLSLSDLHIYLTVPFVLSWSLFDALACGCTVVASGTEPVREVIEHGKNGLLADFYDLDRLVELSLQVLRDPQSHGCLGEAGTALIDEEYAVKRTLPQMVEFFQTAAGKSAANERTEVRPG
jgi:glycosyltransferase involved in cell wall biosynthesis